MVFHIALNIFHTYQGNSSHIHVFPFFSPALGWDSYSVLPKDTLTLTQVIPKASISQVAHWI